MEFTGSAYLYNLSLLGATFATVSAFVTLLRQTMGGHMSNFDIYLLRNFVSAGFIVSITAVIPSLVELLHPPTDSLWIIASVCAAVPIAIFAVLVPRLRHKVANTPLPPAILVGVAAFWVAVALLTANAAVPTWRSAGAYALALTIFLVVAMWTFVRRIGSLVGKTPSDDWDPKKG